MSVKCALVHKNGVIKLFWLTKNCQEGQSFFSTMVSIFWSRTQFRSTFLQECNRVAPFWRLTSQHHYKGRCADPTIAPTCTIPPLMVFTLRLVGGRLPWFIWGVRVRWRLISSSHFVKKANNVEWTNKCMIVPSLTSELDTAVLSIDIRIYHRLFGRHLVEL